LFISLCAQRNEPKKRAQGETYGFRPENPFPLAAARKEVDYVMPFSYTCGFGEIYRLPPRGGMIIKGSP